MSVEALAQDLLEAKREMRGLMEEVETHSRTIVGLQQQGAAAAAAAALRQQRSFADAIIGDKGRPPTFDGAKKPDFHDWNFERRAYIGNQSQKCFEGMTHIEFTSRC